MKTSLNNSDMVNNYWHSQFYMSNRYSMYQRSTKMRMDHKKFPYHRYAHYENTTVQHSPTRYRLLLPTMNTKHSWRYPENWLPLHIIFQQGIPNIWPKLLGSTIIPQVVISSETAENIPNDTHLEHSRRNCPKCWDKLSEYNSLFLS